MTVSVSHVNQRKYAILAYIHSDSSEVHAWNSGAARDWTSGSFRNRLNNINFEDSFIAGNTDYTAGENGGTSKAVISVGAIAARSAYFNVNGILMNDSSYVIPPQIARFSSRGPTVDGRIKPNIVAPGYDVPSSINNRQFAGWMIDRTVLKSVFKNDTQYWSTSNGTSMSAPHVTGIVALLLEANPKLSAAQAEEILETSADIESYMGTMPNYTYGYGRVNAYSAIIRTLQTSNLNSFNTGAGISFFPNPVEDMLHIELPQLNSAILNIFDMQGRMVLNLSEADLNEGRQSIDLSKIDSGMYVLSFSNGGELFTFRLIKK